mgnify:CR=1 FL=1
MGTKPVYKELWQVVRGLLLLSHGQASVERGFSINREISVPNLQERSFVAQRIVVDHILSVGGVLEVNLDKKLISSVCGASAQYKAFLEDKRLAKDRELNSLKRKALLEEIDELKAKKQRLQESEVALNKSADDFALKAKSARSAKDMRELLTKSNSHRKTAKEKLEDYQKTENELEKKIRELKNQ